MTAAAGVMKNHKQDSIVTATAGLPFPPKLGALLGGGSLEGGGAEGGCVGAGLRTRLNDVCIVCVCVCQGQEQHYH